MATLKQRLHRKNGTTYDTIHLETNATVVKMSTTDSTTVSSKITTMNSSISSLNTEMSSLKSSVSSGKAQIASAITDKGVSTSASDSFSQMATNIRSLEVKVSNTIPVQGEDFTYTGNCQVIDDLSNNWRIKFLTSGYLTFNDTLNVDMFLVGAGGGGQIWANSSLGNGGGGGGYTKTLKNIALVANTSYLVTIGSGGAAATNGGNTKIANISNGEVIGGYGASDYANGGNGGSGGGSSCANGGSNGSDGENTSLKINGDGGKGQGTTTREFGEESGDLYSGGGGGGQGNTAYSTGLGGAGGGGDGSSLSVVSTTRNGTANTGGGGGGEGKKNSGGAGVGGSGILIIRNKH